MLPTSNVPGVQNERTITYGNIFPCYNPTQLIRKDFTESSESSSQLYSDKPPYNFWNTLEMNSNNTGDELTASQSFTIDLAGIQQELIKTCLSQDTESVRQEFIRNGIDSAVNPKDTLNKRRTSDFEFNPPVWPKNPLVDLGNQTLPVCSTPKDNTASIQKRSTRCKRNNHKENEDYCVFCFNNGEDQDIYMSHACRDAKGHVMCPRLQRYVCPYCRASGIYAHTKKYCPQKPIITPADLEKMVLNESGDKLLSSSKGSMMGNRGKRALRF